MSAGTRCMTGVTVYSSFDGWARGQPDNNYHSAGRSPYQSCNALDISDRSNFGWKDENCAETSFWTGQMRLYGHICRYGKPVQVINATVLKPGQYLPILQLKLSG